MPIKGTPPNFLFPAFAAEPDPRESGRTITDAAASDADARPASRAMAPPSRSAAYLLGKQVAAGSKPKRPGQRTVQGKEDMAASTGRGWTPASSALPLPPAVAATKLFLGTQEENAMARTRLAELGNTVIGKGRLTVAAEIALWNGKLTRPGF